MSDKPEYATVPDKPNLIPRPVGTKEIAAATLAGVLQAAGVVGHGRAIDRGDPATYIITDQGTFLLTCRWVRATSLDPGTNDGR